MSWFKKLTSRLTRSSKKIDEDLGELFESAETDVEENSAISEENFSHSDQETNEGVLEFDDQNISDVQTDRSKTDVELLETGVDQSVDVPIERDDVFDQSVESFADELNEGELKGQIDTSPVVTGALDAGRADGRPDSDGLADERPSDATLEDAFPKEASPEEFGEKELDETKIESEVQETDGLEKKKSKRNWFGLRKHDTEQTASEEPKAPLKVKAAKTDARRILLTDEVLEELEEKLIMADIGADMSLRISAALSAEKFGKKISMDDMKSIMAREMSSVLETVASPMPLGTAKPQVVLVVGVNGSGKTTTIGKLALQFRNADKSVMIAACDTFRAAAVEQLAVWGERAGVPVMKADLNSDPASLAYEAMKKATENNTDILMVDTAGRLQNRADLMDELGKIKRVLSKQDSTAPHNTILVLDATTGQNAIRQVDEFTKVADVTGLVMTKLDGTAKGGILVALAQKFAKPIHAIGVGESIDDLQAFDPDEFARALAGLE